MLVLSGALAEMAWPVILSKRESFRYGARFLKIFDS
jgi:3-methyladenine DNA glycosylase Tag